MWREGEYFVRSRGRARGAYRGNHDHFFRLRVGEGSESEAGEEANEEGSDVE